MNKKLIIAIVVAIALIALAYWYFIYLPAQTPAATGSNEGKFCTTGGKAGTIQNGTCVPNKINTSGESLPCGGPKNPC